MQTYLAKSILDQLDELKNLFNGDNNNAKRLKTLEGIIDFTKTQTYNSFYLTPNNLIFEILDNILSFGDILNFASTCKRFFVLVTKDKNHDIFKRLVREKWNKLITYGEEENILRPPPKWMLVRYVIDYFQSESGSPFNTYYGMLTFLHWKLKFHKKTSTCIGNMEGSNLNGYGICSSKDGIKVGFFGNDHLRYGVHIHNTPVIEYGNFVGGMLYGKAERHEYPNPGSNLAIIFSGQHENRGLLEGTIYSQHWSIQGTFGGDYGKTFLAKPCKITTSFNKNDVIYISPSNDIIDHAEIKRITPAPIMKEYLDLTCRNFHRDVENLTPTVMIRRRKNDSLLCYACFMNCHKDICTVAIEKHPATIPIYYHCSCKSCKTEFSMKNNAMKACIYKKQTDAEGEEEEDGSSDEE